MKLMTSLQRASNEVDIASETKKGLINHKLDIKKQIRLLHIDDSFITR
jgi:hypothetical protein